MYEVLRRTLAELKRRGEESSLKPHSALVPYIEENCPADVPATWVETKLEPSRLGFQILDRSVLLIRKFVE